MIPQFLFRALKMLIQPSSEWTAIKAEQISSVELFKGYAIPLCLIPFAVSLPIVLHPDFYLSPVFGVIINLLIFSISLFLLHIVSVVVETLSTQMKAPCDRITAMKLSYYSATPALIMLALFPLLQGFSLLGFVWAFILFIAGTNTLLPIPSGSRFRFFSATALLTIAALFMLNLFVVGMITIIVGPQQG